MDGRYVGLILNPCHDPDAKPPLGPLYDTGGMSPPGSRVPLRLVYFTNYEELEALRKAGSFPLAWWNVYIRTRPHDPIVFEELWAKRSELAETPPFCTLSD